MKKALLSLALLAVSLQAAAQFSPLPEPECENVSGQYTTPFSGSPAKVSWNLAAHKVPQAWAFSQGKNVTVGVLDTGIMPAQTVFWQDFSTGLSSGRSFAAEPPPADPDELYLPWHGTKVASIIAAPVTYQPTIAGVAYKSSLIAYAVQDDPVIWRFDKFNQKLRQLADNPGVKIINISMGSFDLPNDTIAALQYASVVKDKLIVASAGVSGPLVIYPAKLAESYGMLAVTGVEYHENDPSGKNLVVAAPNSYGPEVSLAAYVSRPSDGAGALTLHHTSACTSSGTGSSMAAPTIAGIAALVWSAKPSLSKYQVVQILKRAASLYPIRSNTVGYGVVDANRAVRLALTPIVKLNVSQAGGTYTWRFDASNAYDPDGGPIASYYWNFGDGKDATTTSPTVTHVYSTEAQYFPSVTVTDDEGGTGSDSVPLCVGDGRPGEPGSPGTRIYCITE